MEVLIADGHTATRLGIRVGLREEGMKVVGETGDGEEALRLAEELRPDLVVLGLNLKSEAVGIEVLRRMKVLPEPPSVLVHTLYNFNEDIVSCLLVGADGFVHKSAPCEVLLDAAWRVASGEHVRYLGERVGDPRSRIRVTPTGERVTARECEVAVLMLRGLSNTEISERLYLSMPTVKTHVKNVLRKMRAENRWGLVRAQRNHAEAS